MESESLTGHFGMRKAGTIEEDRSSSAQHIPNLPSRLCLSLKTVHVSNTGLSRTARWSCPSQLCPQAEVQGREILGVGGCVLRGQSPGFCLHRWKLETQRTANPAALSHSRLPGSLAFVKVWFSLGPAFLLEND